MRARLRPLFALTFLAACGGNVVVDASTGTGGATGTGASTGTGGATTTTACFTSPSTFPQAYKACVSVGDCTQQEIPTCCTTYVVGVAAASLSAFNAYEAACVNAPECDCLAPPMAENGLKSNIQVECQDGLCMTFGQ